MTGRSISPGDNARRPTETEPPRAVREAVGVLERLLKHLYPDEPPLDIVTIGNVLRLYPLTKLGAPALAAIEQSRRIIRARGDYDLAGLSEFHTGLIYLYWDDCRAAANQFALARQTWSLVNNVPGMCLAHYAQGLGLYHAYHNEAAMLQYGRAERLLARIVAGPPGAQSERLVALEKEMRPILTIAQASLRELLWPPDETPAQTAELGYVSVPPGTTTPASAGRAADATPATGEPVAAVAGPPPERPEWAKRVPMPISNLPGGLGDAPRGPVPGHIATDDRFGWYMIAERKGNFLPEVSSGSWLLADREVDDRPASGREYVVVGSARPDLGRISVQPISRASAIGHCYLGYRVADKDAPGGARLYLDETEQAVEDALVLAVVEGFWQGLNGHPLPGSQ